MRTDVRLLNESNGSTESEQFEAQKERRGNDTSVGLLLQNNLEAVPADFLVPLQTEMLPPQQKPAFTPTSLDAILHGMNSAKSKEQSIAIRAAERLAMTSPEQLLQLTRKEAAFYRARTIQGTVISVSFVGTIFAGVLQSGHFEFLYLLGGSAMAVAMWLGNYLPLRARRSMITVLAKMDDPRLLGSVLLMLVPDGVTEVKVSITRNDQMRMFVTRILMEMLPNVRSEHKAFLSREQMQTLLTLMKQYQSAPQLTISILAALQQIGDESSMPAIQSMMTSRNSLVKAAAQECNEVLSLRADQKRLAMTLLRASDSAIHANPDTLLRAAANADNTEPEQLLRSGSPVQQG